MNRHLQFRFLATALVLALVLALIGHPIFGLVMFILVGAALAPQEARCGVNTLGTLAATQIIIMEALASIYTKRPLLRAIGLGFVDLDGAAAACRLNQKVTSRIITVPSIVAFSANAGSRVEADVEATLNSHDMCLHSFTAAEYAATSRDLIRESAGPIAIAVANKMVDSLAAVWTIGNFPTRTGADAVANGSTITKTVKGAGWDYTHLVEVGATLDKSGVPDDRFYVGNSNVYGSMQTDMRIVGWLNNQVNAEAIRTGILPEVNGFRLDKYPALPTTGNLVAFAGSKDSTVYIERPMRDPREMPGFQSVPFPGLMTTITEPRTGQTINMEMWIDAGTLAANFRLHWLHGEAVGNPNNGQLIVSS